MWRLFHSARPTPGASAGRMRAFTLVEAMVVIAITAVLVALAAPSMRNLIESNGVSDSVDSLAASIAFARAEAIKRGIPVVICPSDAAKTGTVACGSKDAWSIGWITFVDYGDDGSLTPKDTVLRIQGNLEKNGSIETKIGNLRFKPIGILSGISVNFIIQPPSAGDSFAKTFCVSNAGRVRVVNGRQDSC
jgi:type IV fimbrial biogenesis protein FimT